MTISPPTLSEMRATLAHASDTPWSNYKESDYTPEQWHAACLIHQHEGSPTSKSQCKLPVRTPNGTLNSNGVHAAAAALAGARGGVQASAEEKAKAARALLRFYGELNEEAPESLLRHAQLETLGVSFGNLETTQEVLEHYGIKGMRWGFRRSRAQLAKVRNEAGDTVGTLTSKSKAVADKVKAMRTGDVAVLDTDDGPMVVVKMKDGGLKETRISADAESFLRTMNKAPSEMSTREINDAVNRAQKVEAYNKIFNPLADPNAELKARVEAMELQQRYSAAYAKANPSRSQRLGQFISNMQPAFSAYKTADKALNGALSSNMKSMLDSLTNPAPKTSKASKVKATATAANAYRKRRKSSKSDNVVYDITSMGRQDDPTNPYIPQLGG